MSSRIALPQLIGGILLVLAVLVVMTDSLRAPRWETCDHPERLANTTEIRGTVAAEDESKEDLSGMFFEWRKGRIATPVGNLDYQVGRTQRPVLFALNWSTKLSRPYQPSDTWTERRSVDGQDILIRWARQPIERDGNMLVARLDVLGSKPIDSPIWSSLARGIEQVRTGTLPITSYLIEAKGRPADETRLRGTIDDWLDATIRRNREACGP